MGINTEKGTSGKDSANSVESDLRCTSRVHFDTRNVTLTSHNVTLTVQKPCQYNNKFDCSETIGCNIPQVLIFSISYSLAIFVLKTPKLNLFFGQNNGFACIELNPHAIELMLLLTKYSFFIHTATPYIHPRLDSRIGPRFSD